MLFFFGGGRVAAVAAAGWRSDDALSIYLDGEIFNRVVTDIVFITYCYLSSHVADWVVCNCSK